MPPDNDKKGATLTAWGTRALAAVSRIISLFATRLARLVIITLFVLGALYLGYLQVWQPLTATAALPPGVTERNPQLTTELLQAINTQRVERVDTARTQFNVEAILQPPGGAQ